MNRMARAALRLAGVVMVAMLMIAYGSKPSRAADGPEDLKGQPAPEISLKTLDGKDFVLSKLKGKVVVLDFWATWCSSCRASLPHFQKLADDPDKQKAGLRVLAINAQEKQEIVDAFIRKNNYTFPVPLDAQGKTMDTYKVDGTPTTIVIGRDGVIKAVFVGYPHGGTLIDNAIEDALKE